MAIPIKPTLTDFPMSDVLILSFQFRPKALASSLTSAAGSPHTHFIHQQIIAVCLQSRSRIGSLPTLSCVHPGSVHCHLLLKSILVGSCLVLPLVLSDYSQHSSQSDSVRILTQRKSEPLLGSAAFPSLCLCLSSTRASRLFPGHTRNLVSLGPLSLLLTSHVVNIWHRMFMSIINVRYQILTM